MQLLHVSRPGTATVEVTQADLETIASALNEVCNGLDQWDFPIRMGAEKPEVLKLMHRVGEVLDGIKGGPTR